MKRRILSGSIKQILHENKLSSYFFLKDKFYLEIESSHLRRTFSTAVEKDYKREVYNHDCKTNCIWIRSDAKIEDNLDCQLEFIFKWF
jgi:hypothetical protein